MEQQEVNYCNHIPSSLAAASLPDIQKPQLDLEYPNNYYNIIRYTKSFTLVTEAKNFPFKQKKDKIHMSVENPLL